MHDGRDGLPSTAAGDENSDVSGRPSNPFFARGSSSWTDVLPRTEHVDLFRRTDYAATSLGPIADWGPALRFYTTMLFADSRPVIVYWGPDRVAIYNEKSSVVLGAAHPGIMGKGLKECLPTVWNDTQAMFETAFTSAQTVDVDNILLFPERHGYLEETYFIGQFIPIRGDSGHVEGIYNTIFESTTQVLHNRRRKVVEAIASIPPYAVDKTLACVVEALRSNPHDITMAMLYSLDELATSGRGRIRLIGSIGIPTEGLPCAPSAAEIATDNSGIVPFFRQVKESGVPLALSESDGSLQVCGNMFDGVTWSGFGEPSRDIVVLPLSSGGRMLGFYVQGTNPRRAYDHATEMSIVDMARQIEAKWVSSMSSEEARAREEMLERQLTDSERRLRHMAQSAPMGMVQIAPDPHGGGIIEWANDQFYEITGHVRTKPAIADFINVVAPEDRERGLTDLGALFSEGTSRVVSELRLTRKWTPPLLEDGEAVEGTAWMLTVGFPIYENGRPKLVMGYTLDISRQKWAESVQSRNAAAAQLAKSQQEEFIDMTSHEMRNPLTAITQLADSISKSMSEIEDKEATRDRYMAVAHSNVESAKTILACCAHQKRVIDDVLMLSRLESHMLSITPVIDRPDNVVADTVKMFDGEVLMHDTTIEAVRDSSYDKLNLEYILCDRSRLAQILINLISNAIKFTCDRPERRISVVYGAQSQRPPRISTVFGDLKWMDGRHEQSANKALPELNDGETPLYLYFCVQDTGPGVRPGEMSKLFKRFSQASSRTHISYGGSGLGLYICRELAEKQGGGVGVTSRPGEGAIFGFFIETRRARRPEQDLDARLDTRVLPQTMLNGRPDLPQRVASTNETAKINEQPMEASTVASNPASNPEMPAEGFHVLLVEDNLLNQRILAKQLAAKKCTVTVANHGKEALEILKRANSSRAAATEHDQIAVNGRMPDVILMDWEMPVMDGLTCSKSIRDMERQGQLSGRLPIIAVTANVREEQKTQAIAAGMDNVLPKPFTVTDLLARIRNTIYKGTEDASPSPVTGCS